MSAAEQLGVLLRGMVEEAVSAAVPAHRPTQRLLSTREAARYLGFSTRHLQEMVANGELPKVSDGRCLRLDIKDLDAWIDAQKKG